MLVKRFSCAPKRKDGELVVKNGLAITPQKMFEMAKRGIPVTTANAADMEKFGEANPSWEIPIDRVRGVDVATMWEQSSVIRNKLQNNYRTKVKELKSK